MVSRRSVLIVAFAFTLTACGSPKSFDSVSVRGPMHTQQLQPVNAVAAADGSVQRRRQELAFIVGAIRAAEPEKEQPLSTTSSPTTPGLVVVAPATSSLPPDWVIQRESGGDYNAYNPTGCGGAGCFGRYQASGEWACHFDLPCDIAHWTPEQQDHFARMLWDNGRGCSNWDAC